MAPKTTKGSARRRLGKLRPTAIGFYAPLLLLALAATAGAQLLLAAVLPLSDAELWAQIFNVLFAVLQAWLLAGLTVCALLLAWLRLRVVGIVLSIAVVALWVLGLVHHVPGAGLPIYLFPCVGALLVYRIALRFTSRNLIPCAGDAQTKEVFRFLKRHIWSASSSGYMVDGEEHRTEPAVRLAPGGRRREKGSPALVITRPDQAVAISDRLRPKDVRNPGLILVKSKERITQVIDLRPQCRTFAITARTQDGIEVRVQASVSFQIDAGRRKPTLGEPLPFSRAAAFKALLAQRVEHEPIEPSAQTVKRHLWDDLPAMRGEHIARDLISRLDFDDLYGPHELDDKPPRQRMGQDLCDQLKDSLKDHGIQLISVALGNFEPTNPRVYVKRARTWQTEWIRKMTLAQAEGQAERLQILERARADARTELILDVGRQLEDLAESSADVSPDAILDQFLGVVETLMARPQVRNALPQRARDVLTDAREASQE